MCTSLLPPQKKSRGLFLLKEGRAQFKICPGSNSWLRSHPEL